MAHKSFDTTANQEFFDALLRHQIGLLRLSGSVRNDIYALLDATEADMIRKIKRRLAGRTGLNTPADVRRLNSLLKVISSTRLSAWKEVDALFIDQMLTLAKTEPGFVDGALKTVSPVVLETTIPATDLLVALAKTKPFEGKTLKQWSRSMAAADLARISDQIKIGMVQGENIDQISRRIVGTRRANGQDGVTQITRNQAAGVVRTAVNAISNQSKRAFYEANKDVFDKELYVATLDGRTTRICSSLDGQTFPVGRGPIPPLHFNCRSVRVAIIDGVAIGSRPARAFTEKGLVREFARKEGFPPPNNRAGLPFGTKSAYDDFARGRMRQLTGTVPAKQTYQVWLTKQSRLLQDDVLGPTRGKLFRDGDPKLDRFVSRAGDELSLRDLARLNREAFIAAGLDPEDFL